MTQIEAIREVDAYADLKPGWDGYRAPAFDPKVIQMTKALLWKLGDGWEPGPCPDGTISLEFKEGDIRIDVDVSSGS